MGIHLVSDKNKVDDLLKQIDELSRLTLKVGIFSSAGEDILIRANVHEFGSAAKNIPERSFLRAGLNKHTKDIESEATKLIDYVMEGKLRARQALELLGQKVVDWIKQYLTDLKSPPLKPATIKAKGSSNPLIDSGQLRSAIDFKVE